MPSFKDEVRQFMEAAIDYGKKPLEAPLTEEQKKLAALGMAINATIVQFVLEGILPEGEQMHFMMHLGDFAERLYKGELLKMPGTQQTMSVNSEAGRLYALAAEQELNHGHETFLKLKERQLAAANDENEQTNKDEDEKPKYLN